MKIKIPSPFKTLKLRPSLSRLSTTHLSYLAQLTSPSQVSSCPSSLSKHICLLEEGLIYLLSPQFLSPYQEVPSSTTRPSAQLIGQSALYWSCYIHTRHSSTYVCNLSNFIRVHMNPHWSLSFTFPSPYTLHLLLFHPLSPLSPPVQLHAPSTTLHFLFLLWSALLPKSLTLYVPSAAIWTVAC